MNTFAEKLDRIRADIDAGKMRAIDLAREADIPPTSLYSMLDPNWKNQAIANADAVAAAHERLTGERKTKRKPRQVAA